MNSVNSLAQTCLIFTLMISACNPKPNKADIPKSTNASVFEKCKNNPTQGCLAFESLINFLSVNKKYKFLGFDGYWEECNHENHNFVEFFTKANQMIDLELTLIDTTINFSLHYLHRDIREVWGTETIEKEIKSQGIIQVTPNSDLSQIKLKLKGSNLNDLVYLSIPAKPSKLGFEIYFQCKTCQGEEMFFLYPKDEFKAVLTGYRLHLWDGYY